MTDRDRALAGLGFGRAADAYVAGRPDYPAPAVAWLVDGARDVADVGAGTGKLTAGLVAQGCRVTAVEPDAGMLDALRTQVPTAAARSGSAEALPLADATVDAVVFGQAWHWVDVSRASAEAARVLRPGGALGLIWNVRDVDVPWVRELGRIMHGSAAEEAIETGAIRVAPPFGPLERREWRWNRSMTADGLVAMAASRSYVIALPEGERAEVLARVRALAEGEADAGSRVALPYTTVAFRTRVVPFRPDSTTRRPSASTGGASPEPA